MGEELIPAGLSKLYIAPAGDMNPEHLQPIELHSVASDLGDRESHASESTWGNNGGKGYCITGTLKLENNKETRKNLQKLSASRPNCWHARKNIPVAVRSRMPCTTARECFGEAYCRH